MKQRKPNSTAAETTIPDEGRRRFLGTAAVIGVAGAGLTAGISVAGAADQQSGTAANPSGSTGEVEPGQLDSYYGLWSSGHAGEMRVLGIPSGRLLKRIPVFSVDCMSGWGITNESKKIMGTKPDGSLIYNTGDLHHVHASYKEGTYDGKYAWGNDKLHSRLARVRLDTMECDRITEIPNVQGFHGMFPDKRDPVDPAVNSTTRVFCGAEFSIPLPNNGKGADDVKQYGSLFTCVDAETMAVRWQCRVDGNMDLVATSFDGKLAASNQYNTENGVHYEDMMSAERDACVFFHIARIEQAVKDGRFKTIGTSKVPVVDGRKAANTDPKMALTCYVPVPKNPHGVNATPDGKYFICAGKLSPTATVIDLQQVLSWFNGALKDPRDTVAAEPELGLGPLHTAFDGKGNAYTTLFLDSTAVKWNIEEAIKAYQGYKAAKVVLDRLDVHYQPGHINASMSETTQADGKWLAVGCKFSKDRFLPVGPLHPENEQIIDISGDEMRLVHETPVSPEPHDFIIVKRDLIKTRQVYNLDDFPNAVKDPKECRVERHGKKVTVYLTALAPIFGLREFKVKRGDEVTIILTNLDMVEDLAHGFGIANYDINFIVHPQQTQSVTFKADKAGVFWCYCTHFCHALHLEMRSRMIVEV
ncbi:MAG: nitrous-oxide reductase [Methylococcaceae bacterium]|nr:nitrous-oxide reductase [Methylococcaceae bacterium]